MNRAERRGHQKGAGGTACTLTVEQVEEIKKKATDEALNQAMVILFGIPVLVLQEQYGWGGKKRLPEFAEHLADYYQRFAEGERTVDEYQKIVLEKTGIGFELTPEDER